MLAALLTNLPEPAVIPEPIYSSGPFHGFAPGRGTSWNKNWATEYGPDVDKARKARPDDVQEAIKALTSEESLPPLFEDAVEVAQKRSLAAELMQDDESLICVMTAYYALLRWRECEEDDIIALLMLC